AGVDDVRISGHTGWYLPGFWQLDVGPATNRVVTGLAAGATYYCRVMAYNAVSNSPYSVVTSIVTQVVSSGPPDIAHFEVPAGAAAQARLLVSTIGKTYALQYTTNLLAAPVVWTNAASQAGTGGEVNLQDTNLLDDNRYYRVAEQ
ncbi:MAG: fibronectin type III domain-containing protein, partial [Kiritimatiellia bacterium]